MRVKKDRAITSSDKDISLKDDIETSHKIIEKDGKGIRAIVNCDFTEYEPVEEQGDEGKPKH